MSLSGCSSNCACVLYLCLQHLCSQYLRFVPLSTTPVSRCTCVSHTYICCVLKSTDPYVCMYVCTYTSSYSTDTTQQSPSVRSIPIPTSQPRACHPSLHLLPLSAHPRPSSAHPASQINRRSTRTCCGNQDVATDGRAEELKSRSSCDPVLRMKSHLPHRRRGARGG